MDTPTFVTLLVLLLVFATAEMISSRRWVPAYFRYGIPLFSMRVETARAPEAGIEDQLTREFAGKAVVPLLFRRLSPTEIAFRESEWGFSLFHYTPVMHGLIRYRPEEAAVRVIGWMNFGTVAAAGIALYAFSSIDPGFPALSILAPFVVLVLYAIQVYRYRKVAAAISRFAMRGRWTTAEEGSV